MHSFSKCWSTSSAKATDIVVFVDKKRINTILNIVNNQLNVSLNLGIMPKYDLT